MAWTLLVDRTDPTRTELRDVDPPDPAPGEAVLALHRVGVSANNVTYARLGDQLRYWEFFPATDGWGRVPLWGFADVVASRADGVAEGSRVYGFLPTSSHLLVRPDRAGPSGFRDAAVHRAALAPAYNAYADTRADALYHADTEDLQVLFRPLFLLSFTLADQLVGVGLHGAQVAVLSSASSKTAYCTAALLRAAGVRTTGLTSAGNLAFVESLGCYDAALGYDDIEQLDDVPAAYLDFAGRFALRARVHHHLGEHLVHDAVVGMTHQDQTPTDPDLPGVAPTPFFAPDVIRARSAEWGRAGFEQRISESWRAFLPRVQQWVDVDAGHGPSALAAGWAQVVAGGVDPRAGHVRTF